MKDKKIIYLFIVAVLFLSSSAMAGQKHKNDSRKSYRSCPGAIKVPAKQNKKRGQNGRRKVSRASARR